MSEPFIGEIRAFGFNWAPRGWSTCDGQLISVMDNQSLFSLISNTYGGDGRTNFALPDLRSRLPMHQGAGIGLTPKYIGQRGGLEYAQMSINEMPAHSHPATGETTVTQTVPAAATMTVMNKGATLADPTNNYLAKPADTNPIYYNRSSSPVTLNANSVQVTQPEYTGATTVTVGNAGGNRMFSTISPYLVLNYCIALDGLYPSRS
ncbi:MAG: tail fiber protein [Candidatus Neomarinimicrobiota bacterium]